MVVGLIRKVKQPVLTAVCRSPHPALPRKRGRVTTSSPPQAGEGLFIYWVAALHPGGGAALDVADGGIAALLEVAGRGEAPLAAVADGQDRPITGYLVDALLQLPQRNQLGARHVTLPVFPRLPDVQQEGRRLGLESLLELADVDAGDMSHHEILIAGGASFTGHPASFSQREQGPAIPAILRLGRAQAAARLRRRGSRPGRRQPLRTPRAATPPAGGRLRKPAGADRVHQPQPAGCRQRQQRGLHRVARSRSWARALHDVGYAAALLPVRPCRAAGCAAPAGAETGEARRDGPCLPHLGGPLSDGKPGPGDR